jgi:hypothetical protein
MEFGGTKLPKRSECTAFFSSDGEAILLEHEVAAT